MNMSITRMLLQRCWSVLLLACLLGQVGIAQAEEIYPLEVVVNGTARGVMFIEVDEKGGASISADEFRRLRINLPEVDKDTFLVQLNDYPKQIQYELDELNAVLKVTVDPLLLDRNVIGVSSRAKYRFPALAHPINQDSVAYLNYSINYSNTSNFEDDGIWSIPLSAGLRHRGYLVQANSIYSPTTGEARLTSARLQFDDIESRRRWTFGDYVVAGLPINGGGRYFGVNVGTAGDLQRDYREEDVQAINGILDSASQVSIYINGNLVSTRFVPAGRFRISDFPLSNSNQRVEVVIRDSFGNTRRFTDVVNGNLSLLAAGEAVWYVGAGAIGYDYDQSITGRDVVFNAFYRRGVSDAFTQGFLLGANADVTNISVENTYQTNGGDLWGLQLAASYHVDDGEGFAGILNYTHQAPSWSILLTLGGQTENYLRSDTSANEDGGLPDNIIGVLNRTNGGNLYFAEAALNFRLSKSTSWGVSIGTSQNADGDLEYDIGTRFRWNMNQRSAVELITEYEVGENGAEDYSVGLLYEYRFDNGLAIRGGASVDPDGEISPIASVAAPPIYLNDSVPLLLAANYGDGDPFVTANLAFDTKAGRANFNSISRWVDGELTNELQANFYGGLVLFGGDVYASRGIENGFAVLKYPRTRKDDPKLWINKNGERIAELEPGTSTIVSGIAPYQSQLLVAEVSDESFEHDVDERYHIVAVPPYGAVTKTISVFKKNFVEGSVFATNENKEKVYLESVAVYLTKPDGSRLSAAVASKGLFYLEDMAPGVYQAKSFLGQKPCLFSFEMPDVTDDVFVNLGEVECRVE